MEIQIVSETGCNEFCPGTTVNVIHPNRFDMIREMTVSKVSGLTIYGCNVLKYSGLNI
jgi:hypothetical protein